MVTQENRFWMFFTKHRLQTRILRLLYKWWEEPPCYIHKLQRSPDTTSPSAHCTWKVCFSPIACPQLGPLTISNIGGQSEKTLYVHYYSTTYFMTTYDKQRTPDWKILSFMRSKWISKEAWTKFSPFCSYWTIQTGDDRYPADIAKKYFGVTSMLWLYLLGSIRSLPGIPKIKNHTESSCNSIINNWLIPHRIPR